MNCVDFLESGDVIAGDDAGAIRTYSVSLEGEYYMSAEFEAHPKGVGALLVLNEGTVVSGGERDRKMITWDATRDFAKRTEVKLPDGVGSIRSLSKQKVDQVEDLDQYDNDLDMTNLLSHSRVTKMLPFTSARPETAS